MSLNAVDQAVGNDLINQRTQGLQGVSGAARTQAGLTLQRIQLGSEMGGTATRIQQADMQIMRAGM